MLSYRFRKTGCLARCTKHIKSPSSLYFILLLLLNHNINLHRQQICSNAASSESSPGSYLGPSSDTMDSYSPGPNAGIGGWPVFYDAEGRVYLTSEAERAPRLPGTSTGLRHAAPRSSHHGRNPTLPPSLSSTIPPSVEPPPQRAHHHPNTHIGGNRPSTDLVTPVGTETTPHPAATIKTIQRCRNCREIGHKRTSCQKVYCYFCGKDNHMWSKCDQAADEARKERAKIRKRKERKQRGF